MNSLRTVVRDVVGVASVIAALAPSAVRAQDIPKTFSDLLKPIGSGAIEHHSECQARASLQRYERGVALTAERLSQGTVSRLDDPEACSPVPHRQGSGHPDDLTGAVLHDHGQLDYIA